ncbi:MAG: DNA alkylation response protein, partial [Pseudomonadota bacterium]
LAAQLDGAKGADRHYDAALAAHSARWPGLPAEAEARHFAERTAVLLTASVLLTDAAPATADGFVGTRLTDGRGHVAGSVQGLDTDAIIDGFDA